MHINKAALAWINILLSVASVVIIAVRIGFPNHRVIAILLYASSWIPFFYGFRQWKKSYQGRESRYLHFVISHKAVIASMLVSVTAAFAIWSLFPLDSVALLRMEVTDLRDIILSDQESIARDIEGARRALQDIQENRQLFQGKYHTLSAQDKDTVVGLWGSFLDYTIELEKLKEFHKYFFQINYAKNPNLHKASFLIAYAAFITNYRHALIVSTIIQDPVLETKLNEENIGLSIPRDSLYNLKQGLTRPDNLLKLNAGSAYLQLLKKINPGNMQDKVQLISDLEEESKQLYQLLGTAPRVFLDNPLDFFEKSSFTAWFPFQKNIALAMGSVKTAQRDDFITAEQLQEVLPELEPGDILIERRNWHLSNIGIPGFWPHSALFTGSMEEMENYFEGIESNGMTITELLKIKYPEVYD